MMIQRINLGLCCSQAPGTFTAKLMLYFKDFIVKACYFLAMFTRTSCVSVFIIS